jgi:hypothetical protein
VPQDVIQAFLQTHQQQVDANQLASASSIDSVSDVQPEQWSGVVPQALRGNAGQQQLQQLPVPQ